VGGSLDGSTKNDTDVLVVPSVVPPPPLFPPADPAQFHTPVSIKIIVLHGIYPSSLTHAISSLCRDNRQHKTTLMDRLALR
jgi:hypothetical protein